MFVELSQLPDSARLWIYQSNRPFSLDQQQKLAQYLQAFVTQWTAHGHSLKGSADILHGRFIVLAVDESGHGASGCSIDASVKMIRELENNFSVQLLDRTQVAIQNHEEISACHFKQIPTLIADKVISKETLVFDNSLSVLGDLRNSWPKPASQSWIAKYF